MSASEWLVVAGYSAALTAVAILGLRRIRRRARGVTCICPRCHPRRAEERVAAALERATRGQ